MTDHCSLERLHLRLLSLDHIPATEELVEAHRPGLSTLLPSTSAFDAPLADDVGVPRDSTGCGIKGFR
jgi:hypothetical protein